MPSYIDTGDITRNRHRNNPASVDANTRNLFVRENDTVAVYGYICASPHGITSKEIAARMGKEIHCISGRITQLKADGKVVGTKQRRDGCEVLVAGDGRQASLEVA